MNELSVSDLYHRMAYRHDDLPLALFWSEKSGCTSLFQWLLLQTGEFDEADTFTDWIHDWEHAVMKARPGYAQSLADHLNAGGAAFKLVRNPFERAVSSYLMLVTLGDDSGHFTVPMRQQIREFVYGDPDVPYSFGFIDAMRWLATQDITTVDGHLGLQHDDIERRIPQLEIIRLEHFGDEMRTLEQRFGLPSVDLQRATKSRHHTTRAAPAGLNREGVARLHPPIPLFESGFLLPRSSDFMTDEAIELVSSIYRIDIEAYGYEPPPSPAPASPARGDDAAANVPSSGASDVDTEPVQVEPAQVEPTQVEPVISGPGRTAGRLWRRVVEAAPGSNRRPD